MGHESVGLTKKTCWLLAGMDSVSPTGVMRNELPPKLERSSICPKQSEGLSCRNLSRTASLQI